VWTHVDVEVKERMPRIAQPGSRTVLADFRMHADALRAYGLVIIRLRGGNSAGETRGCTQHELYSLATTSP
jgi:hypothetical protein